MLLPSPDRTCSQSTMPASFVFARLVLMRLASVLVALTIVAGWVSNANAEAVASTSFYIEHIKPLLAEKCVSCHGPLEQHSGLRLDAGKLIHEFAEETDLILPDRVEASELLLRVTHPEEDVRMPPSGEGTALDEHEIDLLRRWIETGADFPEDETYLVSPKQHWAFQPLRRPKIPQLELDSSGANDIAATPTGNPIDAFLQQTRVERGVRAFDRADPEVLQRRLSFSLTGLPARVVPASNVQVVDDNEHSQVVDGRDPVQTERDYERTVDRMLASPEHAERWARHWMDVWRYSDWDGYKEELRGSQRHIWHWRDWIVDSLAADKPYDQMVVEMLAADELDPLNEEALRATGFLARNFHKSNRNIWLDATVEHTAKAFLGLTIDCAKCHDHKYDPIAQEEFYQFRAIFEPHQIRTDRVAGHADTKQDGIPRAYDSDLDVKTHFLIAGDEKRPDESRKIEPQTPQILGLDFHVVPVVLPPTAYAPHLQEQVRQLLVAAQKRKLSKAEASCKAKPDDPIAALALVAERASLNAFLARYDADEARFMPKSPTDADGSVETRAKAKQLRIRASTLQKEHRLAQADWEVARKSKALDVAESSDPSSDKKDAKAKQKRIEDAKRELTQAEAEREKAFAAMKQPDDPSKVSYDPIAKVYPHTSSGRRLALARWITSPNNPLAARVAVNHIWMRHFGKPLVQPVSDFGLRAPEPLHRDLLDWLAVELMENGWKMKPLHRLIVSSDAFALASSGETSCSSDNLNVDPDNLTYWRFDPIRLEAEAIRDSLLAVADQLDRGLGGPDIDHARGEDVLRRSLYFRHAYEKQMTMLTTFDAASPNECYRRDTSVIPQQALVLANSKLSRRMSEALAEQVYQDLTRSRSEDTEPRLTEQAADESFVPAVFQRVLGRRPSKQEQFACREFLNRQSRPDEGSDVPAMKCQQARASLVHVLINHNDFVTIR